MRRLLILPVLCVACNQVPHLESIVMPSVTVAGFSSVTDDVVITYAQGQASGSLHVQWTGSPSECPVDIWYSRYGETIDYARIDTRTLGHEFQYRPRGEFNAGRYRVSVCGVWSRWMYLEGDGDGRQDKGADGGGVDPEHRLGPDPWVGPPPPQPPDEVDDGNNGHGNDPDHDDASNPGQGGGNHGAGR